jgi:gluconate 2-dehydrogenase gamma chain
MADKDRTAPANPGRRDMMKRVGAGVAGATVAVPAIDLVTPANAQAASKPAPAREALETLTAMESDTLEAMVARIIPTDENGPGAAEARAAHYIDRALAGPLASRKGAYVSGLAALDAYARSSRGAPFANLSAGDQDAVLTDVAKNAASGFANAAAFFNMVRAHTIEGTFCDPYYGGNANFVGWDLIGYPGVRMVVSAEEQSMSKPPKVVRRSAYDEALFSKRGGNHGH